MEQIELQRAIEAILFAAGERVEIAQLVGVLEADKKDIMTACRGNFHCPLCIFLTNNIFQVKLWQRWLTRNPDRLFL